MKQVSEHQGFYLMFLLGDGLEAWWRRWLEEEEKVPWHLCWYAELPGARHWTDMCRRTLRTARHILGSVCGQHTY